MKKLKVYLDTSIINYVFADDAPDNRDCTIDFFKNHIKTGAIEAYISQVVVQELNQTENITKRKALLHILETHPIKTLTPNVKKLEEIEFLAGKYISETIIPKKKIYDALHVAYAIVFEMDFLISWNFKHLANIFKERPIVLLNQKYGYYYPFRMTTPMEVMNDENI